MAATGVFAATPSKRGFSDMSFEAGLEDRENCSPMRVNANAQGPGWVPPAKRARSFADLANARPGGAARAPETSSFPSVGVPQGFVSDQMKGFVRHQKKAARAAAAGGVLAVAAAQFRASPGPVRFADRAQTSGAACHDAARAADAMQQSSPLRDCGASGDDIEDDASAMDGAGCGAEGKPAEQRQRVFTWAEVERILHSALQQQEAELRRHYDDVLQTQLHEQFTHLSRSNQDHISRSMQSSTHDYFG